MINTTDTERSQLQDSINRFLSNLRCVLEDSLLNNKKENQLRGEHIKMLQSDKLYSELVYETAKQYCTYDTIMAYSLFDAINVAISIADDTGCFLYVNKRYTDIFGYSKDEIIGKHFAFLLEENQREIILNKHHELFQNGFIKPFETKGRNSDGTLIDILISTALLPDKHGKMLRVTTIKDISHEKRLYESLITKNKIFDYSTELLSIIGYDGYFKLLNPSWCGKLGWSIDILLSKPFIEFVHPDDIERTNEAKFSIIDGQEVLHFENRYITADGTYKWLSWNAQPVPEENIMVAVARDITKEKELKEALDTKNLIFEYSLDLLCVAGFDGYYKLLNPIWEHTLGWTLEELKAKPFIDFVHPQDRTKTELVKCNIVNGKEVYQFENRILCADGSFKWISWNSHPLKEKQIMVGVGRDVTESKKVIQKLIESEEKFKSLVEDSKTGVYILKHNRFVYVNEAMCKIFGYYDHELIGKPLVNIIQPAERVRILKYSEQMFNEGVLLDKHISFEGKNKKGESVFVEIISNVTHYQGELAIIGSLLDVTEQYNYFNHLKKLYSAIEQTQASVVITNVLGEIEFVNDAFLKVTGYTREEAMGKNPRILKSGITPQETYDEMWACLLAKKSWQGVLVNRKKNGSLYWESVNISPITNDLGETTNYVAVKEDITSKIHEEEERKLLIEELTRSNKELKQFSYITSHNMRAPLTNLLALDTLIDRTKINDKENVELIELMHESIEKLNDTLNDLIKILIIKEQTSIELQEVVFEEVFQHTVQSIKSLVKDAEIHADFSHLSKVMFNSAYLESIFLNLLTNAVKYAYPGRKPIIKVSSYEQNGMYYLSFSDNGLGLNMHRVKDRIFGLYQRFHNNSNSKGIGLYLVHSQITALGGTIEFESEENVGTTFTICFNPQTKKRSAKSS